jgi:hypothetical protein
MLYHDITKFDKILNVDSTIISIFNIKVNQNQLAEKKTTLRIRLKEKDTYGNESLAGSKLITATFLPIRLRK